MAKQLLKIHNLFYISIQRASEIVTDKAYFNFRLTSIKLKISSNNIQLKN